MGLSRLEMERPHDRKAGALLPGPSGRRSVASGAVRGVRYRWRWNAVEDARRQESLPACRALRRHRPREPISNAVAMEPVPAPAPHLDVVVAVPIQANRADLAVRRPIHLAMPLRVAHGSRNGNVRGSRARCRIAAQSCNLKSDHDARSSSGRPGRLRLLGPLPSGHTNRRARRQRNRLGQLVHSRRNRLRQRVRSARRDCFSRHLERHAAAPVLDEVVKCSGVRRPIPAGGGIGREPVLSQELRRICVANSGIRGRRCGGGCDCAVQCGLGADAPGERDLERRLFIEARVACPRCGEGDCSHCRLGRQESSVQR